MANAIMLGDLRYALRLIRKSPLASAVAILTVAIGVGANTAIFSIIRAVLLKPLPYADADRLVEINERWPTLAGARPVSTLNYLDWVAQSAAFERIAATSWGDVTIGIGTEPFWIGGSLVSPSYFDVFGLHAAIGRTFAPTDDQPGRDHVVILGHRLWTSRFGGDSSIVGSSIRLNGEPYTVIGVMPPRTSVHFFDTQVWRPLTLAGRSLRGARDLSTVDAKLKPGVTLAQARTQMNAIADRLARQYPDTNKGYGVIVEPLPRPLGLNVEASLYLLFAAVGVLLLIACVNLANLAIVRGAARAREVAIRSALGAGRAQVVRQFLTEHLLIAAAGGLLGILIGYGMLQTMRSAIPTTGLRAAFPPDTVIAIDRSVWLFAMALATLAGVAFGLAPALGATQLSLVETIRDGTPGVSAGRMHRHLRHVLVVAEVALAFVLLTGAGLLIQSLFTLTHRLEAGYDPTGVLTARLPIPETRFESRTAINAYFDRITESVQQLPGIRDVAFADAVPTEGFPYGKPFQIVGQPEGLFASRPICGYKVVSPSYFRAVSVRLIAGRLLAETDREGAPFVIVINETMARTYFKDVDPIGQRLLIRRAPIGPVTGPLTDDVWTVVGVIADEGVSPFEDRVTQAAAYATRLQHPRPNLRLVVRTAVDPLTVEDAIRKSVAAVDRDQAVSDVKTMRELESEELVPERLRSIVLSTFAAVATVLTALGVYGVLAYSVVQRTREIGIRAALGATHGRLLRLVLAQAVSMISLGLLAGAAAAFVVMRLISSLLVGIVPADPKTMAAVAMILAGVAFAACYVPARRAAAVDPLVALKSE